MNLTRLTSFNCTVRNMSTAPFVLLIGACGGAFLPAQAAELNLGEVTAKYTLTASYAAAWRIESPDARIIDAPGDPRIPVSDKLKYPQSNNFDDGDRNFDRWDMVNNRISLLGDVELSWQNYGVLLRGDTFYDFAYHGKNANIAPDRLNTDQQPPNTFTRDAQHYSGQRSRLLDAYAYAYWRFDNDMALSIKAGRHIAAWGQSLFFSGVALAQSTADATRSTIPGVDVKSILLPTHQISMRFTVLEGLTLLGQYQFEFKPFEIDPVGTFYSVTDVVGPGRQFAYGFLNPLFLDTLGNFNLTDLNDLAGIVETIDSVVDGRLNTGALTSFLSSLGALPVPVSLPGLGINPLRAPEGINPMYGGEDRPRSAQYGAGLLYTLTDTTEVGAYYLRYHQKTPAPTMRFGKLVIIPGQALAPGLSIPDLTTQELGLSVPEVYIVKYFDNVDLYALSISTMLWGVNVGGELIRRQGVDVLLDIDEGINGIIPTPTRANTTQALLNGIYTFRPPWFFDAIAMVGELGYIRADGITPQPSHEGINAGQTSANLTADREAWAFAALAFFDRANVLDGWDMRIPLSFQMALKGRSPLAGAFGSLFDQGDIRVGAGIELTYLQRFTVGLNYSGFTGRAPHFFDRPLQDRDTIGINLKYNIF